MCKRMFTKLRNSLFKNKEIGVKVYYDMQCPEECPKQREEDNDRNTIKPLKKQTYGFILYVVIIGALVPYAAQFIIPLFNPTIEIDGVQIPIGVTGVEIWNQFVSIVLGIVATIMSIVSLVLGFYSLEESNKTERRTRDLLIAIEEKMEIITENQKEMKDDMKNMIQSRTESYNTSRVSADILPGAKKPEDETID